MNRQSKHIVDQQIVKLLNSNNREGLSLLYDTYAKVLYGVIFRITQQKETAEEVLQDAILKIWKNSKKFDANKGNLLGWAINIARNAAIDRVRLKKINVKTQDIEPVAHSLLEKGLNPDTIGLKEITEKLNPKEKAIVDLIYFNGYTQSETAEALDIPLGTVKTRLRAAMLKLRAMFSID